MRHISSRSLTPPRLQIVKIKQYVYFGISSEVLTAEIIARRIGLAADKTHVRGSPRRTRRGLCTTSGS
jgi:hypothetical protein